MQLGELMVNIGAGRLPVRRSRFYFARRCSGESLAAEAGISADAMRMQRDRSRWQPSGGYWRRFEFSVRTACAQSAVETVRFRLLQGDTQYMKTFYRARLGSSAPTPPVTSIRSSIASVTWSPACAEDEIVQRLRDRGPLGEEEVLTP